MTEPTSITPQVEYFFESKGIPFLRDVPMSGLSTWKIGGPADYLVEPSIESQISDILVFCRDKEIPYLVIGKGSNLLFDDAGLRGVVIRIDKNFAAVAVKEDVIIAQSGISVPRLARLSLRHELSGLEHTVGIPGNLGGLLAMNGGSQRQNIGNCVEHVWGINTRGRVEVFSNEACDFEYRRSVFQSLEVIITKAELKLRKKSREVIRQDMLSVLRSRRAKFPRKKPNCGSVFKIHPELFETVGPPGKVIEEIGFKGLRIGNAEVSRRHANFIVNRGGATAVDVLSLIREIKASIVKRFAVNLICEVIHVNSEGKLAPAGTAF